MFAKLLYKRQPLPCSCDDGIAVPANSPAVSYIRVSHNLAVFTTTATGKLPVQGNGVSNGLGGRLFYGKTSMGRFTVLVSSFPIHFQRSSLILLKNITAKIWQLRIEHKHFFLSAESINRPLPGSKIPQVQNEARCTTFLVKMSFISMKMKNDFHIKGWARTLVLKQRPEETRKWPIQFTTIFNFSLELRFAAGEQARYSITTLQLNSLLKLSPHIKFSNSKKSWNRKFQTYEKFLDHLSDSYIDVDTIIVKMKK